MEDLIMAKRIVKWSLDGSILKLSKALENNENVTIDAEFDLTKLFPEYKTLNEVQQQLIVFGTRQKLMDVGASEVGNADGKISSAKKQWEQLLTGKWAGERVNGTGASESKRIATTIKGVRKNATPEQLIALQTLGFSLSADEQKIVDEFNAGGKKKK